MTLEIPLRTVSHANSRAHWAAKAKRVKAERDAVRLAIRSALASGSKLPELPCVVTFTRIAPRALDDDNLRSTFKGQRDEVATQLEVDDRDPRVRWEYAQEKGAPNQYGVRIEITGA